MMRSGTSNGIARIATAGVLLAMASAWRLVADGAVLAPGVVEIADERTVYMPEWRYAEFALAGLWLAPFIEIVAFVLLMLVIREGLSRVSSVEKVEAAVRA
ncbi:hypothetical protein [Microbacterium sp. SA156]|uniref:hypothetical protein n=1 Tax=unclassified Microbacterium TaxID=2609290 RepID=UPI003B9ECEAC